jgi:hypothetical protein
MADVILNNDDFDRLDVRIRPGGRLSAGGPPQSQAS